MAATTSPKAKVDDITLDVRTTTGSKSGTVKVAGSVFGITPNVAVMHQVVTAQLAAARAGTHSTKTRAEVRGGGAKPYRQKGTGRARQGSIRAPHYAGGGVAHGPKPRDYRQRTPKKMVRLALRSALSDRVAGERIAVLDEWGITEPKTKAAVAALEALEIPSAQRVLVVLGRDDTAAAKSLANLAGERRVHTIVDDQLNAYDVLVADWVVFTKATIEAVSARLSGGDGGSPPGTASSSGVTSSKAAPGAEPPDSPNPEEAETGSAGASDSATESGSSDQEEGE